VVVGGAGTNSHEGSGGGAGDIVYMTDKVFNMGTYKINVGSGGTSTNNGNDSSITTNANANIVIDGINLIGRGGWGGTGVAWQPGKNGGSGGGGTLGLTNGGISTQGNTFWNGTMYIPGGHAGEKPPQDSKGGGGGGSAEIGGTDGICLGGDGRAVSITGTSLFYAGGGGGANPGGSSSYSPSDGGGGIPNMSFNSGTPTVGTANTGSGGGGSHAQNSTIAGASGGSGIVIIRYNIINNPQLTYSVSNPNVYYLGNVGIGTTNPTSALHVLGSVQVNGGINTTSLAANTKNFKIEHPLNINKWLYHGCVESSRFDNIYRGKKLIINGRGEVDIDEECNTTGGMTKGTFESLNTNCQVYLQNKQTYDGVKGSIKEGKISINCENTEEEIEVDWLVIGERKDENIKSNKLTNNEGKLICEHEMEWYI